MDRGRLDRQRFLAYFDGMLQRDLGERKTAARAYGEMVDLLWQDQNVDAAIELEELLNDLARAHSFSLLCSYAIGGFSGDSHTENSRPCAAPTRT